MARFIRPFQKEAIGSLMGNTILVLGFFSLKNISGKIFILFIIYINFTENEQIYNSVVLAKICCLLTTTAKVLHTPLESSPTQYTQQISIIVEKLASCLTLHHIYVTQHAFFSILLLKNSTSCFWDFPLFYYCILFRYMNISQFVTVFDRYLGYYESFALMNETFMNIVM